MFKKTLTIILATIATTALLTACSSPGTAPTTPDPEPTITEPTNPDMAQPGTRFPLIPLQENPNIQKHCPNIEAVSLQESGISPFTKETKNVYVCKNPVGDDGLGENTTTEIYQVGNGMFELLQAYNEPNDKVNPAGICIQMLADPLIIYVQSAGAPPIPIYAPVDECGFPQESAVEALNNAELTPVPLQAEK